MSIFGFIKESKKSRALSQNQNRRKSDFVRSPLDDEPDDPAVLAEMLTRSFESSLSEKLSVSTELKGQACLHTVRKGETFQSIAKEYYGNESFASEIISANGLWLEREGIFVGQVLHVHRKT